ncbi:hypothetical protein LK07_28290 [Streptomyces pluripotens]|uniref:ATP-grasp domain-containing protein n=1 Tax=Streptomyces pluripotens TaxID=1355015 RepID=A0A221P5J1_9ACTN|nr:MULTISPECIES: hypothetical protein [Streptomyces]ARP73037.1 hypothetical protein LK06_027120 [Streptomyces pluripotens]ASN27288.1 hypothetical protein LK07_28290 [Streptomyces pluripotens]KIE28724.1 hypothetical protein LK08_01555 [Streptomyces sp. MUSC 125]MCH0557949.1 hypothetical protein [Streptomyces sp. MUM 16J]
MTVVILDRTGPGGPLPYAAWLAEAGHELVLVTDTPGIHPDIAEVHALAGYPSSAAVETTVLDLAARHTLSAVVALHPADQLRAAALRDTLGLPGQSREEALVLADSVAAQTWLRRAGLPVVERAGVRRVLDLYRAAHAWGYPLAVRRRRGPEREVVAVPDGEAALRAFIRGRQGGTAASALAGLTVEPVRDGRRHQGAGLAVTDAVLSALPLRAGHPYAVEAAYEAHGGWRIDSLRYRPGDLRAQTRAQAAPLAPTVRTDMTVVSANTSEVA